MSGNSMIKKRTGRTRRDAKKAAAAEQAQQGPFQVHAPPGQPVPAAQSPHFTVGSQQQHPMQAPMFAPQFAQNDSRNLGAAGMQAAPHQQPVVSPHQGQSVRVSSGGGGAGMGGVRVAGGAVQADDPRAGGARPVAAPTTPVPRAVHQPGTGQALQAGQMTPEQAAAMAEQMQAAQQMAQGYQQMPPGYAPPMAPQMAPQVAPGFPQVQMPQQPPMAPQMAPGFPQVQMPQQPPMAPQMAPGFPQAQVPQPAFAPPQGAQAFPQPEGVAPQAFQPPQPPQVAQMPGHLHPPGMMPDQPPQSVGEFPRRVQAGVGRELTPSVPRGSRVAAGGQAPTSRTQTGAPRGLVIRHVEPKMETREEVAQVRPVETKLEQAAEPVDLTVWMTVFRRPAFTGPQLQSIEGATAPPRHIYAFVNNGGVPIDENALAAVAQVRSNLNMGPWPRFMHAAMAETEYVCILDDDAIPGPQWFEQAMYLIAGGPGIVGVRGGVFAEDRDAAYVEFNAATNPNEEIIQVDVLRGGWLMRTETLRTIMRGMIHHQNQIAGWDIHIASEATRRGWPLLLLPCTPETAGTVVAPVEDENSLSAATDAHAIRDHVYQTYRVAGWVPASLDAAKAAYAEPEESTGPKVAVPTPVNMPTSSAPAPAPESAASSTGGDGDGDTAGEEG